MFGEVAAAAAGHTYFKMKVGSENHEDDVARAAAIREEIGDENTVGHREQC